MQHIFPFVFEPMEHQRLEWLESRDLKTRALFWEMGTGKSKVIIDTIAWLWYGGHIDTVILIAKKGEYSNWKYVELPAHMPRDIEYDCELYRSGLRASEKEAIRRLAKPSSKLRILCVNVESMPSEGGQVARGFAATSKKGMFLTVDESTCVKNHKAVRSKAVYLLAEKYAKYTRILCGTPITRSPLDIWGQALVLGKKMLGHTSFTSFKSEYAIEEKQFFGARSFNKITGFKNIERLNKQIKTFGSIKERSECVDLPDKIYQHVAVPLTGRQEELYEEMRDTALVELGDGEVVEAVNALGIISRLDQITVGQLRKEDGTFETIESNRPEALLSRLDYSQTKGIIWCNYRGALEHLYSMIQKEYGPEMVGRYYGGVPDEEREETVRNFQDPEHKLKWIVANQQSMGYGRTLTLGKENHYYSNGYNLEHRLQSEDRTMRIGQTENVLYTDYSTPGTVNDRIRQILRAKKNLAHEVLGTRIRDWI